MFALYSVCPILVVICWFFPILIGIYLAIGHKFRNISVSLWFDSLCSDAMPLVIVFLYIPIFWQPFPDN